MSEGYCVVCKGSYPCAGHPDAVGTPSPIYYVACEHRPDTTVRNPEPCVMCQHPPERIGYPTPDEPTAAVKPVLSGTFAIYEDGRGGYVLFTDTGDGPQRKDIPAALVKMATGGGVIGKRLAGIFG